MCLRVCVCVREKDNRKGNIYLAFWKAFFLGGWDERGIGRKREIQFYVVCMVLLGCAVSGLP